ncbi:hypothetical protein F543_12490 [Bibersteinia trehalosi USDA-ARS-USMARC-189]|uniref:Uncharacterized protein n=1 Tax=Bibersteinia trehalosi USDA-ARS-USMARC-189 TaxID=1263831 RepID=A0ABN4C5Q4_BIBTR|nr:hypothetical protein WQG_11030 [Bibersteinia trehalosi USDA-ARS-USMARC-192]AHG84113.1 hypothetical protein F543_12490 [Bibersteinia trehalosi USDA-ARS-USMARC-189]
MTGQAVRYSRFFAKLFLKITACSDRSGSLLNRLSDFEFVGKNPCLSRQASLDFFR